MTSDRSGAWTGHGRAEGARLPADDGYWDDLAGRVTDAAFAGQEQGGPGEGTADEIRLEPFSGGLADSLSILPGSEPRWLPLALAASAVLAVLGTWLGTARPQTPAAPPGLAELRQALGPEDPLARALLLDGSGPPISELIRASSVRTVASSPNGD